MEKEGEKPLLPQKKPCSSDHNGLGGIELRSFRLCLNLVFLDQSTSWRVCLSWLIFFLLAIFVPMVSHFFLLCSDCDEKHRRPYDAVVQLSLSVSAAVSFVCLSSWTRKYGLRKFLFLDRLRDVSEKVRLGYAKELQKSMKFLSIFVLPSLVAESAYRIWWYATGTNEIPYVDNKYISNSIACAFQLCSWFYRISIFILACILYHLTCHLQILRLEDFAQVFRQETEVGAILDEHLNIRKNLRIISHRFRRFIILALLLVTASQFMALVMAIRSSVTFNIYEAGELALCSVSLLTGLFICLRSATKITHRAQSVTSLAARWHVSATINSFDELEGEAPTAQIASGHTFPHDSELDSEEGDGEDDDLDNAKIFPIYARTISFQKRQALVSYLENNRAGITVYGFMVDRTGIHTIFGIELALLLWLLNKTLSNVT